jgi:hypothetical protein
MADGTVKGISGRLTDLADECWRRGVRHWTDAYGADGPSRTPACHGPVRKTALPGLTRDTTVGHVHQSRVCALLIDAPEADADAAAAFWSAALGATARPVPQWPWFTMLHRALPGLETCVQAVDDAPRYHLDIETDDVEAETARLLALGAAQVSQWLDCRVLRAPGGHLVCVIPVHSDPDAFKAQAATWP